MLSKKALDYIHRVLKQGYSEKQIEDALIKRGFDRNEVDEAINAALTKIASAKGLKKSFESAVHKVIQSKADRLIASFAEKMLKKGYYPDQVEKTLVNDGYKIERVRAIVSSVQKSLARDKVLHDFLGRIGHLKDAGAAEINFMHHHGVKIGAIISVMLLGISTYLFSDAKIMEAVSVISGLLIAAPIGAYTLHHISVAMHDKEIHFKEGLRYIVITAALLLTLRVFISVMAMLAAIPIIIYFLGNILISHFGIPRANAYIMTTLSFLVTFASAYTAMASFGLLVGLYNQA